jgi:transposase
LESGCENPTRRPAILEVKTLLNWVQPLEGFVYAEAKRDERGGAKRIEVAIRADARCRPRCGRCLRHCRGYDRQPVRRWGFVPLWAIAVELVYAPRRVECPRCGVRVEHMPWSRGKRPWSVAMMVFLAGWARRLSWKETARAFGVSWEAVFRSVEWVVQWGLGHRVIGPVEAIGIDEIHTGRRRRAQERFVTLIYQIDKGCRRLLWIGRGRTVRALRRGLLGLGEDVLGGIRFVCSDMWKPYLAAVRKMLPEATHIIDRFHIAMHLNEAVDKTRRAENAALRGRPRAEKLKKMRWVLLRRGSRVRGRARQRLAELLNSRLKTATAWMFKETFGHFWKYKSSSYAYEFLCLWTAQVMRSRIEPMKKVARMLRAHEDLILNWFKARGAFCAGAVEGLNNKIRVVTRRSYGLRTHRALEIALYHTLGKLPEPPLTHRFC